MITRDELRHVLSCCMVENGLHFSDSQLDEMTDLLFEDADVDSDGSISVGEFKMLFLKHPGLVDNISLSIERWLLPLSPKQFLLQPQRQMWSQFVPRKFKVSSLIRKIIF